jgi:uncharacterized RDD family membrane protein YckC
MGGGIRAMMLALIHRNRLWLSIFDARFRILVTRAINLVSFDPLFKQVPCQCAFE